jgi:hypothetical protein
MRLHIAGLLSPKDMLQLPPALVNPILDGGESGMSKQVLISVTVEVSEEELGLLYKILELSREREKNAIQFIKKTALPDAIAHAVSTVPCRDWKEIQIAARNLGVESPV